MTGRRASGFIVPVKTLRKRQFSSPPAACGHMLPNAVALILWGSEGPPNGRNSAREKGYAVGASKRAVPVGGSAYGIPRNWYMLDETLRPVMGPARVMTVVCDDRADRGCGRACETIKVAKRRMKTSSNNRCMVARQEMWPLTMLEKWKKRWKGWRELKEINSHLL